MRTLDQTVARLGLGRAISLIVEKAVERGTEPAAVIGALVDTVVSYADYHHRDVEAEIIEPARRFAALLRSEGR